MFRNNFILFICIFIFLGAFLSACTVTEGAVVEAIEQTRSAEAAIQTAEAESQNVIGTAVAVLVAEEVQKMTGRVPVSDLPEPIVETDTGELEQECAPDCIITTAEDIENLLNATATIIAQDIMDELEEDIEDSESEPDGSGGGGAEIDACERGLFICAENITDSRVNVRQGPGVQWEYITSMAPKDKVPVECMLQNGWLNITLSISLGRTGWVDGRFMDVYEGDDPRPDVEICKEIPPTPKVWPTATPTPTSTPTQTPSPTATSTPTPEPSIYIFVFNGSSTDICRLEVYSSSNTSGKNRLGSDERLDPMETKAIELSANADGKNYDFRAWDCHSDHENDPPFDREKLEIDEGMTWTITEPQESEQDVEQNPAITPVPGDE